MTSLPSKYKHLRLMITRGAKAVSTKELFAVNQKAQVILFMRTLPVSSNE
jgi:hypothetical protein